MAGLRSISFVFLYFCIYFVKTEECVVYNFEDNVDFFNNDKFMCTGVPSKWSFGNYSQAGIESPNHESESYFYPSSTLSCASSVDFPLSAGGTVEFKVYTDSLFSTDHLTILVSQIVPGGNDAVVGSISWSLLNPNSVNGWQTLRIESLMSTGTFQGYITVIGMATEKSVLLIDSFRYIPPNLNSESCTVYEEIATTTETPVATTSRTDGIKDCVTYNFEKDFEIRFTTDNYLCTGFPSWHLDNYTSIHIPSPNSESTVFMTPNEALSCIASFLFKMEPEGIIEANIFMDHESALDHIIVIAQKKTEKEYDTVAGFKMYYPDNSVFKTGWNILRFSLLDLTSFDGYLLFFGSAQKGSVVLVDSVRYIPPLTPPDDSSCDLY